jgi:hypothetical protein
LIAEIIAAMAFATPLQHVPEKLSKRRPSRQHQYALVGRSGTQPIGRRVGDGNEVEGRAATWQISSVSTAA